MTPEAFARRVAGTRAHRRAVEHYRDSAAIATLNRDHPDAQRDLLDSLADSPNRAAFIARERQAAMTDDERAELERAAEYVALMRVAAVVNRLWAVCQLAGLDPAETLDTATVAMTAQAWPQIVRDEDLEAGAEADAA